MAGGSRPWTREEHAAALRESYATFHDLYPDRSYDAWRLKRQRPRRAEAGRILGDLAPRPKDARAPAPRHPQGWEPGVAWDGQRGSITVALTNPDPKWDALLREWGFDPALFEVVEPVQFRTWDAAVGNGEVRRMFYYRANVRGRVHDRADIDALISEIREREVRPAPPSEGPASLVVNLSDWQLGKEGTKAAVERIMVMRDRVCDRIDELRRIGRPVGVLNVMGLGDVIENCAEFYPMQPFTVELNRRDQVKLGRRLLVSCLTTWAPRIGRMVVAAVGGNHGENRQGGKAFTDFGDNDDVAVFEQAAEILAANPDAYGHVSFVLPDKSLTLTLDVAGQITAIAHGHQAKHGPTPQKRLETWWSNQAFGMRAPGDATILITGHYHHFSVIQNGPRTHFQAPTMDSGSQWVEESSGTPTVAGTLTFRVDKQGWHDLQVLR